MDEGLKISRKTLEQIRAALIKRSAIVETRKANFEREAMIAEIGGLLGEPSYSPDWANVLQLKGMDTEMLADALLGAAITTKEVADILDAWLAANTPTPEPNMFWLQGAEETPAVEMPLRIAEEIEEELGIGIGTVECAVRLPDRKMRV